MGASFMSEDDRAWAQRQVLEIASEDKFCQRWSRGLFNEHDNRATLIGLLVHLCSKTVQSLTLTCSGAIRIIF